MTTRLLRVLFLLSLLAFTSACTDQAAQNQEHAAERPPNIIVIFSDDQGWADLGAHGVAQDVRTPHLDRLAMDGVRFSSGYVTAPQCSPSRAGLLTGRYQQRFGFGDIRQGPLPLGERTIADRLSEAGYATGMVGKWHLDPNPLTAKWAQGQGLKPRHNGRYAIPSVLRAPYLPGQRGFREFFSGNDQQYLHNFDLSGNALSAAGVSSRFPQGYRIDLQTEAALWFIKRNHHAPFFLYLAYFAPHVPLAAPPKYLERFPETMKTRRRYGLAMISAMDDGVGRIRELLERLGLTEDTLVFFISDNGAPLGMHQRDLPVNNPRGAWDGSVNYPLNGEKGMLTEGGVRVPFLAAWPGMLPAGVLSDLPVSTLDVASTAASAAGLQGAEDADGIDLASILANKTLPPDRCLFWRFWGQSAVRCGRWKLIQLASGQRFLFEIETHPQEQKNLVSVRPDVVRSLATKLEDWGASLLPPGLPDGDLNKQEVLWYSHYLSN